MSVSPMQNMYTVLLSADWRKRDPGGPTSEAALKFQDLQRRTAKPAKKLRLSINGGGCIEMFDSVILFPIHFHMYIYIYMPIFMLPIFFPSIFRHFRRCSGLQQQYAGICREWYTLGTIRVVFALFTSSQAAKQLRPGPGLLEEQLSALRFLDLHGRPIGS